MALIVNNGKTRLDSGPPERVTRSTHSHLKAKALRLITPQYANDLGIPAEAPVFVSPYINTARRCRTCNTLYSPLLYQVGRTTTAQHFCKSGGGGIYVRLVEDLSGHWVYENDLWDALCAPTGPIRMGNDHGYQFREVKLLKMVTPCCFMCHQASVQWTSGTTQLAHGTLITNGIPHQSNGTLVPICARCTPNFHPTNSHTLTDWNWRYDGTDVTFSPTTMQAMAHIDHPDYLDPANAQPLTYEAFMARTSRHKS